MIYYKDENVIIRSMEQEDSQIIYNELLDQNYHPSKEIYDGYYIDQETNKRFAFIAEYQGSVAGYTTLFAEATTGPFAYKGIPEVVDLHVFIKYQNKGIGNIILDVVEKIASEISNTISLGVGLHSGYGAAQRIYVKRNYIPDGSGVWYMNKQLDQYCSCYNDDDLVLYLSKSLH